MSERTKIADIALTNALEPNTKCPVCGCDIDKSDFGDCDTCAMEGLCGDCVTKHYERGHSATLRPTDDPVYREENNIVEMCRCGHFKSDHSKGHLGIAEGHGACNKCDCRKFTWKASV